MNPTDLNKILKSYITLFYFWKYSLCVFMFLFLAKYLYDVILQPKAPLISPHEESDIAEQKAGRIQIFTCVKFFISNTLYYLKNTDLNYVQTDKKSELLLLLMSVYVPLERF